MESTSKGLTSGFMGCHVVLFVGLPPLEGFLGVIFTLIYSLPPLSGMTGTFPFYMSGLNVVSLLHVILHMGACVSLFPFRDNT